ncbi:MAG: DUF2914 domain-containing protein [Gammaproteobacteria bacterium]|nr:DUF2914 domain-containing protein [Gammaproteobacteria bacterium]
MRYMLKLIMLTITFGIGSSAFAGEVSRAMFTTAIDDREPVIAVDSISSSSFSSLIFFTELNDLQGHNITHQWVYAGDVMFEKTFEVSGARWRVWTSKTFLPGWTGTWTVNVLDDDRSVLTSNKFEYQ